MNATKWWVLAALVLGLVGAFANDRAAFRMIPNEDKSVSLEITDEGARRARAWSRSGWLFIAAAFVCGAVAEFVQS